MKFVLQILAGKPIKILSIHISLQFRLEEIFLQTGILEENQSSARFIRDHSDVTPIKHTNIIPLNINIPHRGL